MNKEFYERLLLAEVLARVSGTPVVDVYRDVAAKEDIDTTDYLWVNTVGCSAMECDDAITDICFSVLGIKEPQPRMRVFLEPKENPRFVDEVRDFIINELIPYLDGLLAKYEYLYKAKFDNYQTRGKKGYLTYYEEWKSKVKDGGLKTSNSF